MKISTVSIRDASNDSLLSLLGSHILLCLLPAKPGALILLTCSISEEICRMQGRRMTTRGNEVLRENEFLPMKYLIL